MYKDKEVVGLDLGGINEQRISEQAIACAIVCLFGFSKSVINLKLSLFIHMALLQFLEISFISSENKFC